MTYGQQPQQFVGSPRVERPAYPNTPFGEACKRLHAKHGARFVAPTDARWIDAYNTGACVLVETTYSGGGTFKRWGYVGLTSGWRPVFMLLSRRNARDSSDLLDPSDVILESKGPKP